VANPLQIPAFGLLCSFYFLSSAFTLLGGLLAFQAWNFN
jgi:hypothetical protein